MIVFEKVRWRNFLSTGDEFTEVFLNKSPSTLIVGQNGAGKSTLLDALSFTLFGKPHREIKKSQLVNSINGKKCIVEVEFSIGSQQFKIVRGIKPNKFEIWQNGNQINQDSNARDFQKYLELNILKLNHKSFHQIVILGSSSFIPFMQLQSTHRREVIEDILDINVFTKMNQVLKEKAAIVREEIRDNQYQLDLIKDRIEVQEKYINDLREINSGRVESIKEEIQNLEGEEAALQEQNEHITDFIETYRDAIQDQKKGLDGELNEARSNESTVRSEIKALVKEAKFFSTNDTCPTCEQGIDQAIRETKLESTKESAAILEQTLNDVLESKSKVESDLEQWQKAFDVLQSKATSLHANNQEISRIQGQIKSRQDELGKLTQSIDIVDSEEELEKLVRQHEELVNKKSTLIDQRSYNDACSEMLKDTGIKTKIVKEYIPVINQYVNQYLQVLDFFVSFHLDENFDEVIRSRHRDDFNYASFSEGEKQRIDLALMFTWRQIARMKNSANTNLLVLDETFDSSLDNDGIENLMKILDTLDEKSNVFIISHKGDVLENKFRNRIEFIKEMNFSKIKK